MRFTNSNLSTPGVGVVIGRTALTIASNVRSGWQHRKITGLHVLNSDGRFFDESGACAPEVLRAAIGELQTELHGRKPKYVQIAIADPAVSYYATKHEKRISVDDANALARWHLGKVKGIASLNGYSVESQVWRCAGSGWRQLSSAVEQSLLSMLENEFARTPLTIIDSVASYVWNRMEPEIRSRRGAWLRLGPEYWTMQMWEGGSLPHLTRSFWRAGDEVAANIAREFARTLRLSSNDGYVPGLTVYVDAEGTDAKALVQAVNELMEKKVSIVPRHPRLRMREAIAPADIAAGDVSWPR